MRISRASLKSGLVATATSKAGLLGRGMAVIDPECAEWTPCYEERRRLEQKNERSVEFQILSVFRRARSENTRNSWGLGWQVEQDCGTLTHKDTLGDRR